MSTPELPAHRVLARTAPRVARGASLCDRDWPGLVLHPHETPTVGTFLGAGIALYALEFIIMAVMSAESRHVSWDKGALAADLVTVFGFRRRRDRTTVLSV